MAKFAVRSARLAVQLVALTLAMIIWVDSSQAYTWWHCDGTPMKWETNRAQYDVMRCSIPEGSQRAADVIYGFDEWNAIHGMYDVFSWQWGTTECVRISHDDGRNQVYFGVPAEMDGAVGTTYLRYTSCVSHIVEADVAFNASAMTEWGNPPCNTYNPPGSRTTIVHEFGHALGLDHDDRFMNLMMTSDGEGKYCGNFVIEPHPDDASGGRFLYGSGNRSTDIGASASRLIGSNDVDLNDPTSTVSLCPGDSHTFKWSVGNMGTEDVTYDVAWVLSTNNVITLSDIWLAGNVGALEVAGDFSTWTRTATIPATVSFGAVYYLGIILDYEDRVPERRWSNNNTYFAGKIRIWPASECR
jgi:hypothetical protein